MFFLGKKIVIVNLHSTAFMLNFIISSRMPKPSREKIIF